MSSNKLTQTVQENSSDAIISVDSSKEHVHTNTKEANKEKKIGCFARIWQFFSCKKRRQKKIEKYNRLFNEYLLAKETLCAHEAFIREREKAHKAAKESAIDAGNKAELLALHKEKRKEVCALQAKFNEYLQTYEDILVQLNKLDPKKHPLFSKEKKPFNLLVFLRIKKVKKPVLNKYEQLHGKKILEAFKTHSAKLHAQQADELGIKKIIYEDREKGGKKHLFFHHNRPIGHINFEKDIFPSQRIETQASPQYKTVTHKNENSLFFSFKSPFNFINNPITDEKKLQLYRDANNKNRYFDGMKNMFPAYYVNYENQQRMIARVAGEKTGYDCKEQKILLPIKAFKDALLSVENIMKKHIYITDVKPANMMISQNKEGELRVNLIDLDSALFDFSKPETKDEREYICVEGTEDYSDQGIIFGLFTARKWQNLKEARFFARANILYGFLSSMYELTRESKSISFRQWCKQAIKKKHQMKIINFWLQSQNDNYVKAVDNLSEMINWDYVVQQHN